MKKIALVLPLAAALLLSACNNATDKNADSQADNSRNETAPKTIESATANESKTTARDKIDATLAISADANLDEEYYKIDAIKFMYRDAVKAAEHDYGSDDLDTLFAYADRELQNTIALIKSDPMSGYTGNEYEISDCNEVRYIAQLTIGNGYSIGEVSAMDYKLLNDGKVRASIMVNGDENIDAADFMEFKDFALSCQGESCKIADVYDSYGDSAKLEADKVCR